MTDTTYDVWKKALKAELMDLNPACADLTKHLQSNETNLDTPLAPAVVQAIHQHTSLSTGKRLHEESSSASFLGVFAANFMHWAKLYLLREHETGTQVDLSSVQSIGWAHFVSREEAKVGADFAIIIPEEDGMHLALFQAKRCKNGVSIDITQAPSRVHSGACERLKNIILGNFFKVDFLIETLKEKLRSCEKKLKLEQEKMRRQLAENLREEAEKSLSEAERNVKVANALLADYQFTTLLHTAHCVEKKLAAQNGGAGRESFDWVHYVAWSDEEGVLPRVIPVSDLLPSAKSSFKISCDKGREWLRSIDVSKGIFLSDVLLSQQTTGGSRPGWLYIKRENAREAIRQLEKGCKEIIAVANDGAQFSCDLDALFPSPETDGANEFGVFKVAKIGALSSLLQAAKKMGVEEDETPDEQQRKKSNPMSGRI